MGNVLPFPSAVIVRHEASKPVTRRKAAPKASPALRMSPQQEEQIDRLTDLLVERTKRRMAEWQGQQGMPSEESALVARLAVLAGSRGDGLNTVTLYQLDALLTFAGWRSGDV